MDLRGRSRRARSRGTRPDRRLARADLDRPARARAGRRAAGERPSARLLPSSRRRELGSPRDGRGLALRRRLAARGSDQRGWPGASRPARSRPGTPARGRRLDGTPGDRRQAGRHAAPRAMHTAPGRSGARRRAGARFRGARGPLPGRAARSGHCRVARRGPAAQRTADRVRRDRRPVVPTGPAGALHPGHPGRRDHSFRPPRGLPEAGRDPRPGSSARAGDGRAPGGRSRRAETFRGRGDDRRDRRRRADGAPRGRDRRRGQGPDHGPSRARDDLAGDRRRRVRTLAPRGADRSRRTGDCDARAGRPGGRSRRRSLGEPGRRRPGRGESPAGGRDPPRRPPARVGLDRGRDLRDAVARRGGRDAGRRRPRLREVEPARADARRRRRPPRGHAHSPPGPRRPRAGPGPARCSVRRGARRRDALVHGRQRAHRAAPGRDGVRAIRRVRAAVQVVQ